MRLFNINPYNQYIYNKIVYDYLYETDNRIDGLQQYIDRHNPNWMVLNEKVESVAEDGNLQTTPYFSTQTLLLNNIIKIVIYNDVLATALCITKLKLHKGLLQQYGENCYGWYDDPANWSGDQVSYSSLSTAQQTLVQQWLKLYDEQNSSTPLDPSSLIIWVRTQDSIPALKQIDQGIVVFNNFLEEDNTESAASEERSLLTSYRDFSFSSAGDIFIPTQYQFQNDGSVQWTWTDIPKGTDIYGTNFIFHLPGPAMRLILPQHADCSDWLNTYELSVANASNSILAFNLEDTEIIPQISNIDLVTWDGIERNSICSELFIKGVDEQTEEFICDDSIEVGATNFVNYRIPFYTITIENMLAQDAARPDFQVYLMIA